MVLGFKNRVLRNLLHAEPMVNDSRKTSMLPISINSRLNIRRSCLKTVTSSWQYFSKTSLLSKTLFFSSSYHVINSLLRYTQLDSEIRYVGNGPDIVQVLICIKIVWIPDLVTERPNASGNLRSGIGKYETLYKQRVLS